MAGSQKLLTKGSSGEWLDLAEKQLTKSFIMMRIFVFFVVVPFFHIIWRRFDFVPDTDMNFF